MMYEWISEGKEPPKETYTTGTLITRDNYKAELEKEGIKL
jgi:L-arabinose transport system substrate-binding protein